MAALPVKPKSGNSAYAIEAMDAWLRRAYAADLSDRARAMAEDVRALAGRADAICLLDRCKIDRRDAARRFAETVANAGFGNLVSCDDLKELRQAAHKLTDSGESEVRISGEDAMDALQKITCAEAAPMASAELYASPTLHQVPDDPVIGRAVALSLGKYTGFESDYYFYRRRSWAVIHRSFWGDIVRALGKNVPRIGGRKNGPVDENAALMSELNSINRKHGYELRNHRRECIQKKKCEDRADDYFLYTQGQWEVNLAGGGSGGVRLALNSYLQIRPALEEIAVAAGIPPELTALMVGESLSGQFKKSSDGARGDFQIMDEHLDSVRQKASREIWGIQADDANYDERDNPFFAMQTAAQILKDGEREVRAFTETLGCDFDETLLWYLTTSYYHAGGTNLFPALEIVKKAMIAKRMWKNPKNPRNAASVRKTRLANGRALFRELLSGKYKTGAYGEASRGYPLKFMAMKKLAYEKQRPEIETGIIRSHPHGHLSVITITGGIFLPGVNEIARIVGLEPEVVRFFNRQFSGDTDKPIEVDGTKVERIRILLPSKHAALLAVRLAEKGFVESKDVSLSPLASDSKQIASKEKRTQKVRSKRKAAKSPAKRSPTKRT